jgi:hypothetical protein
MAGTVIGRGDHCGVERPVGTDRTRFMLASEIGGEFARDPALLKKLDVIAGRVLR